MIQPIHKIDENTACYQMVQSLCKIAKTGLSRFYQEAPSSLPFSVGLDTAGSWKLRGVSIRYATISQIGIAKWLRYHPHDKPSLPDLWPQIVSNFAKVTHVGDVALALWAGATNNVNDCKLFAEALSANWQNQADSCNTVELSWIIQGCTMTLKKQDKLESYVLPVLNEAKSRLVGLYRSKQKLFQRHNRSGFKESVSRRIACFADQVYAILALSNYSVLFGDKQSAELAVAATEKICQLQGPLGQWWWHYDTTDGKVCEEYPVFSVHQDAMAPMAIMASGRLTGENHFSEIERGLRWIYGNNELNENLLLDKAGIIWRDIEKRELLKISRSLRALLCVAGLQLLHRLAGKCFVGFRINYEFRPYHLGWILYSWADYRGAP